MEVDIERRGQRDGGQCDGRRLRLGMQHRTSLTIKKTRVWKKFLGPKSVTTLLQWIITEVSFLVF
jgi:hypothetical protein